MCISKERKLLTESFADKEKAERDERLERATHSEFERRLINQSFLDVSTVEARSLFIPLLH